MKISIDSIDRRILELLQEDSTLPISEIAERVGLTTTPCWRRIHKLEETGVILRRVTLLDPQSLNVGVTVFVDIKTNQHNEKWLQRFKAAVAEIPEVIEFHRMSGDVDYLLKVVVPDIDAYQRLIDRLLVADVGIDRYFTYVVTREVKAAAQPPVALVTAPREEAEKSSES